MLTLSMFSRTSATSSVFNPIFPALSLSTSSAYFRLTALTKVLVTTSFLSRYLPLKGRLWGSGGISFGGFGGLEGSKVDLDLELVSWKLIWVFSAWAVGGGGKEKDWG